MYQQFKEFVERCSKPSTPTAQAPAPTAAPAPQEKPKPRPPERQKTLVEDRDLMISYSHANRPFMRKMKEYLNTNGLSVWVDEIGLSPGVDFLGKIGEAIIVSKCFLTILSPDSVKSKYCQDELALAYISNKPIFPVAMVPPAQLYQVMDTGMKLQLARFKWFEFFSKEDFEKNAKVLVEAMSKSIEEQKKAAEKEKDGESNDAQPKHPGGRHKFRRQASRQKESSHNPDGNPNTENEDENFWRLSFGQETEVPWNKFRQTFLQKYGTEFGEIFPEEDQIWLLNIIKREFEVQENGGNVTLAQFTSFCTVDGDLNPFWQRVQDQAVESYTMKEVFSMDSTVRLDAIENLGRFRSSAVIEALIDLLSDADNNVRSVAAISLARTGESTERVVDALMTTLDDRDRLVRESGCLALGHLKAKKAVKKILHIWRNDFISHVREAATVALEQIGGEEAEKAIHMTKVLSEEIHHLTSE